ncbi:MAG TPA: hypothetical protein VK395_35775 [Gemmataceae bacterium]|nr:hypothetical protein [Gemmataceae bacterium]
MSRILELPDAVYAALEKAAQLSGTTPVGWIAAHLPTDSSEQPASPPQTLGELLEGKVGRINSGGKERFSENCAEKFTDYLEQKRTEGRL